MKIICPKLKKDQFLPAKYTCDGEGISPPLQVNDIPKQAKSLALVVDDPDAPNDTFTHWLLWNIHPVITKIEENSVPLDAVEGLNSGNTKGYYPPCPPSDTHRYRFKLYALDKYLSVEKEIDQQYLEEKLETGAVAKAELVTRYSRS